ncbi:PAS domain S-box protein [Nostocaceae cyanobacterium CENA369]|uniref:Circadian input-output histidine kinase CikA n=1 Tax=Dendronalium phyllosphericum CENA369 TaxID=1725256 RepID=A0A8J7HYT0_9NOST|nr:PAS domain S-box protein [Dendronalium phyllosphericum]MBH8571645.1 PAS domain S-box protein [Dendronalium phyllosphericum CENA369]
MSAEVWGIIPEDIEQVLARICDGFVMLDCEWRYVYVNDKLAELAQIDKQDFLGKSIWELFPETVNSQLAAELHRAVAEQVTVQFEYFDAKRHLWLEKRIYPSHKGVSILTKDITQYKRTQQLLAAQYAVTRILAEAIAFSNAIPSILQALCESLGWQVGRIWSVDHQTNSLHCISSWRSSSFKLEDFPTFYQRSSFAFGEGLPGQVWASGQFVWSQERAAIGFPLQAGNKILGVIEFFSREMPEPDFDLLQVMKAIATQIGQFVEQKQTESLLRKSEARYRSLAEATTSIVWTASPHGSIVEEIPTWQAFTGQTLEQYKQWGWVNALHPEDRTSMLAVWKQGFFNRTHVSGEYRLRRYDGEYRYVVARGVPILDDTGQLCEWVGMCVDISERKQAEIEREQLLAQLEIERTRLVASNTLLDTLVNNAPIGIGIWDEKLRYVRLNDALAEINGLPQAAHIGKTVAEVLPGIGAEVIAAFRRVAETGQSAIAQEASGETPAAPGKKRYWSVTYYPIKLPGNITWVGAICEEITERKLADAERENLLEREQAARVEAEAAKEQITNILESISDGFLAFDREWHFTYLNHEGSRTLGRSGEELLGKNLWQEFPELTETSFGQLYQRAVAEGVPLELEDYYPPFAAWFAVRAYPSPTGLALYFRNINRRKQAEAALRENEAGFRLLAENSTDIISRHTVDGILLYISPACYTLLGYKPKELIARPSSELVHPDDLAEIVKKYPIDANLPDIFTVTHRAQRKDGHYIWLESTIRAIRDSQTREIIEMQAAARDITDRKREEDKQRFLAQATSILAASLDYETTFTSLAQLVVPEIADWCVVDIIADNQSVRRVATAHADASKQKLVEQLKNYPPDLNQAGGVGRVIQSRKSQINHDISEQQMQAATCDAEHLQLLQQLAPKSAMFVLLTIRERILGAITLVSSSGRRYNHNDLMLAEDVARRAAIAVDNAQLFAQAQRSQQAAVLAAARTARLQALTAALSQSLSVAQVAEVIVEQGMAALGASSALVALVTESGTELEIIRAVGHQPELIELWRRFSINAPVPLAEAVRTGEPVWQEPTTTRTTRYSHLAYAYARYNYDSWISIPLTIEGRTVGGMSLAFAEMPEFSQHDRAFVRSLAQQCAQAMERARLYEAEQTAREVAETANRIKDEFLAVLSHELRSPLNPILGWSKLLQTKKLDEKTISQALKTIERNAKLQAQLIEDLLDISRILQGKLSLNSSPVDLTLVISAAMETVRLSAEAKSIQIHPALEPNIGKVVGDSSRLQQIVWNLLSNAVKFTPEGGRVDIRLEKIATQAQITVNDTGKGIDPNFLPYVFDYFRQENSTTTRKFGGLGLGLAIVRHLVELHGGTVKAESLGENQGATFSVRLPLLKDLSESKLDSEDFEPTANLNGVKILIVDDDADTREFIAFLLEQYGAYVTAVTSATEVLAALSQSLPDVLLSDIGMPEVDGCMLIRQVRTLPPEQGGQIPAIALTAYAGEMNEQQVLTAGFNKHIAKPVEPARLVEAIANLLQNRDYNL